MQALSAGWRHALELGDYVRSLIAARADRAALEVRRRTTKTAGLVVAGVAVVTVVISASLRLVRGVSDGLAALFQGRTWLGDLASAVLILGGLAAGWAIYVSRREKKELEEHIEKYESHHRKHRNRHGRFVGDPAPQDPRRAPRP